MALVERRDALEGGNVSIRLPGVQKGDMAARNFKPEVNVFCVRFSPTAQSWAAATTEGLLIYSLDRGIVFDPLNLSLEVTPKAARDCLDQQKQQYSTALLMALKLNEVNLIEEIIEQIPHNEGKQLDCVAKKKIFWNSNHFFTATVNRKCIRYKRQQQ